MSTQTESAQSPRCPQCHEPVRPGSAFCGNCGASVSNNASRPVNDDAGDDQATATFIPVSSSKVEEADYISSESSPWASPESDHYAAPTAVSDPPSTTPGMYQSDTTEARPELVGHPPAQPEQPQGVRGLFLGILALILIGAVFALYLYDAWLSDSARATIEGWLPWLE